MKAVHPSDLFRLYRRMHDTNLAEWQHGFSVGMIFGILLIGSLVALVLKGFF